MRKEVMPEANSKIYYKLVDSLDMDQFKEFAMKVERYYLESGYFFNSDDYETIQWLLSYLLDETKIIIGSGDDFRVKNRKIEAFWKDNLSKAIWNLSFKKNKKLLIELLKST